MTTTSATVTTVPSEPSAYKLGDVNDNGFIDAIDASDILMEYAIMQTGGSPTFSKLQKKAADVNGDGIVDATDASDVLSYYAFTSTGGKLSFEEFLGISPIG